MAGEKGQATLAVEPPPASAHPPTVPGLPTVDGSYRSLLTSLPAELREKASHLPWRLGLTRSPTGGWGDFVGLHPNRELPLYAADDGDGELAIPRVELRRFLHAHHLGGFCWLLRDRIEDGQVDDDPQLRQLGAVFDDRWREALTSAMGDGTLTEALCGRAAARWQRGTRAEHRLLAARSMRPPIYASVVKEKLSWIAVPSQALLMKRGTARRVTAFLRAHDLFMLGLQAIDDVIDINQDKALHGGDVPTALGCSAGALMRVAPKLVQRAAEVAAEGRFGWFARWLEAFAQAIAGWRLAGDALVDELDAIGIAGEVEEEVLGGDRLVQVPTGAPAAASSA